MAQINITRNGEAVTGTYSEIIIKMDGSEKVVVPVTYADKWGQQSRRALHLSFPGVAADTMRDQIEAAVQARAESEIGD